MTSLFPRVAAGPVMRPAFSRFKAYSMSGIKVLWFFPTPGDGHYLGSPVGRRNADFGYLKTMASGLDSLGYYGALLPTGVGCPDAWVVASGLAAVTQNLRFLVAIRPGIMQPSVAARMAATFDRMFGGRLLINVVTGSGASERMASDGVFVADTERYKVTDEFLTIWRTLLETGKADFHGDYLRIEGGVHLHPPLQKPYPPLWFGGSSDEGIRVGAKHSDVYLTWGEPPAQVKEKLERVKEKAAELGRTVRFGIRLNVIVRETNEEAWNAAGKRQGIKGGRPMNERPLAGKLTPFLPYVLPVTLLLLWQVLSAAGILPVRILPAPLSVAQAAGKLIISGDLWRHLGASTARAVVGLLIGGSIGFVLGLLTGLSRWAEAFLDSSVQMLRTIPNLAIIPLVILWLGIGEEAKVFLIALGVFFPLYLNTYHGIRSIDPNLREMARVYGLRGWNLFRFVLFPGALPSILIGLRFALGTMWLTLIAAEALAAESGIGFLTTTAREFMQTDIVVVGTLIYALLGKLADSIARALERRLMPYNPNYARPNDTATERKTRWLFFGKAPKKTPDSITVLP